MVYAPTRSGVTAQPAAPPRGRLGAARARRLGARYLGWLFPAPCLACGALLGQARERLGLCGDCRRRLVPWPGDGHTGRCATCARLLAVESAGAESVAETAAAGGFRCSRCRRRPPPYERLLCAWSYQPPLDAVITALKFRRLDYLGPQLGRTLVPRLAPELGSAAASPIDAVVPVPLHWSRLLRRGYNQAALIARPLAAALGVPSRRHLVRRRRTPAQSSLGRRDRQGNLRGAFRVRRARQLRGRRLLLVDDVTTTGTTLRAAAERLRHAGARSVVVAVVARTPDRGELSRLRDGGAHGGELWYG